MRRCLVLVTTVALAVAMIGVAPASAKKPKPKGGDTSIPSGEGKSTVKVSKGVINKLVQQTAADLQDYWDTTMPEVYNQSYDRVRTVAPYNTKHPGKCGGEAVDLGNAFYCFADGKILYDNEKYYPQIYADLGPLAIETSLAHEWGHAIQDRVGLKPGTLQTIYAELQADCFAGSWVAHINNGESTQGITIGKGDTDVLVGKLLGVRDPVGTAPDDPQAHGTAFDRVNAYQEGFEQGAQRCAQYPDDPPKIVEIPFTDQTDFDQNGNLPADQVLPGTIDDLNNYWGPLTGDAYTPLTSDNIISYDSSGPKSQLPTCGGTTPPLKDLKNRVFICTEDKYLGFDAPFLGKVYDNIGDFAVSTLIGDVWAEAVQFMNGLQKETSDSILQADCFTGAWAGTIAFQTRESTFTLSPGDLDELVQVFLIYPQARGVSNENGAVVFPRLEALRIGFFQGLNACLNAA